MESREYLAAGYCYNSYKLSAANGLAITVEANLLSRIHADRFNNRQSNKSLKLSKRSRKEDEHGKAFGKGGSKHLQCCT